MSLLSNTEIILISYNSRSQTVDCINSIIHTCYEDLPHITVVDNASSDDTVEYLSLNYPDVRIIRNEGNLGYAKAVNAGVRASEAETIIASNTDVLYLPEAVKNMISTLMSDGSIGCVGPQQLTKERKWSFSNGDFPGAKAGLMNALMISPLKKRLSALFYDPDAEKLMETEYIDGASIAFRRSDYDAVGGWDEDYFFYTEEADFCYRIKKPGKRNISDTAAKIVHFRGGSTSGGGFNPASLSMLVSSKLLFCRKHRSKANTRLFVLFEIISNIEIMIFTLPLLLLSPDRAKNKLKIHRCIIGNWLKYFRAG